MRPIILAGVLYLLIGRVFAIPTSHAQAWRLAAWLVSGIVFTAHLAYEQFKLRHIPRVTATHVALAVALGAFALAVAGGIRSLWVASVLRPSWFLALILWPAVTAIPAFCVALVAAAVLSRLVRRAGAA